MPREGLLTAFLISSLLPKGVGGKSGYFCGFQVWVEEATVKFLQKKAFKSARKSRRLLVSTQNG